MLPFTADQFFAVLAAYNGALGPVVLVLCQALGLAAAGLALVPRAWAGRALAGILAAFWGLMGAGYHWGFFTPINPAAWGFGAAFLAEAVLLAWLGAVRGRLTPGPLRGPRGAAAALLAVYALAAYPAAVLVLHPYPESPLFGAAPCPTTIFTLAVLIHAGRPVFWRLAAIPLLWSAIGGSAAWLLGVVPDYGLLAAGLVALFLGPGRGRLPG